MDLHELKNDLFLQSLYGNVLRSGSADQLQLFFHASVLDRYRQQSGYSILRSNTVGRVKRQGVWSIDFGISADDRIIHTSLRILHNQLPEEERPHWLSHAISLPVSTRFIQMQMSSGSCIEDGETRPW